MLVGIGDAAVMLFLEIVLRKVRIAAATEPELLDELLALFVGIELKEGISLAWRNDVDDIFVQPLLVLVVKLFEGLMRLSVSALSAVLS